jgi:hypothetical protein
LRENMNRRRAAQPTKFEGPTSWAVFRQQFETVEEHSYRTPREKATYPIAAFNELTVHILHGIPTGATYKKFVEGLENQYGDHLLEAAFHSQLKRRIQFVGESLLEIATAIEYVAHRAHIELLVHLNTKEAARAFYDGLRKQDIKQQIHLGGQQDTQRGLTQGPLANNGAGTTSSVQQTTVRTLWRSQSPHPGGT